jgi:ATP-dependent helicase/nuclease subunit B
MRLITGPAGSGKTSAVLQEFRQALQKRDRRARLLAPTATMARFARNRFAREGFVFPPEQISTLHRFLEPFAPEARPVSEPLLHLLVEEAVKSTARPEFACVAGMPGFCASLARTIGEFSAAGCGAERLRVHIPDTPLGEAFAAVYRATEELVAARGFCLRHQRLARVAEALDAGGAAVSGVWMDGFYSLTGPELAVIGALARRAEVTIALSTAAVAQPTRERLLAMGFRERHCQFAPLPPRTVLVEAATMERECDEIARRILRLVADGRNFREFGVIVRSPELYGPVLRASFERFGVPARYYFDRPLLEIASAAYCARAVEAMLSGWDFETTLRWLRTAPGANGASLDRFDFALRRAMPGRGLAALRQLAGENAGLLRRLDSAAALESWQALRATPRQWAERFSELPQLYRAARPHERATHEDALAWREEAAALAAFSDSMQDAATCFPGERSLSAAEFWEAAAAALRLAMHRTEDLRRNTVNVLTAFEARQWRLPFVFVCGLVEKQFPKYQSQNPFFPDAARRTLQQAGLRLRTSAEIELEESFLFDSALSRASEELVLSYPKADARGEQNLPSLYLDRVRPLSAMPAQAVRPHRSAQRLSKPASRISSPALLARLAERHEVLKPTALERFAQCPFQFFAADTLRFEAAPPRPEERLDFRFRGNVVHAAIAEWTRNPQPVEPLFARIFDEAAEANAIPPGYRTEAIRQSLLEDLARFLEDEQWPPGMQSETELPFEYELSPGVRVKGRIDRMDRAAGGRAYIVDYKYSARDYTRNESLLQGPLYLVAARRCFDLEPAGMYYCGVRDGVKYRGWSDGAAPIAAQPLSREWMDAAVARTLGASEAIRAGRVDPNPTDRERCRYCDFRDLCRIESMAAASLAEGA